ncbi:oxysterol-binding protein hes1 [Branchiostoma belcheri]|nr:oxysterol-binding protein hes1 [Branchiostoma belcheri]
MEKRRRARINESLNQLKTLILDAQKKDSSRQNKLEKADILEMTVRYFRDMRRHQLALSVSTDPSTHGRYRAGFNHCTTEVSRFTEGMVDPPVRQRLLSHLTGLSQTVEDAEVNPGPAPSPPAVPVQPAAATTVSVAGAIPVVSPKVQLTPCPGAGIQSTMFAGGIPVVPGQVSGGEPVVVLLPSQAFPGGQVPSHVIPVYANATLLTQPAGTQLYGHGSTTTVPPQSPAPQNGLVATGETPGTPAQDSANCPGHLIIQSEKMGDRSVVWKAQTPFQ